jgi:hypothetical protein
MTIRFDPQDGITDEQELFEAQKLLDSYEARLGEVSLQQYFAVRQAVIVYIAHKVHDDLDWDWSTPGAVQDILLDLRRSMETQASLQTLDLTVEDLLQEMYLRNMPAANTLAA